MSSSTSDPFRKPIVSPRMVGRDAHLAALRRCLDEIKRRYDPDNLFRVNNIAA